MAIAEGKSRLDLVKEGVGTGIERRGRKVVPIEKVVEDPRNERKTFRNMEGLIASVNSVGIIEPITVAPIEGDSFMIVTGHRRFRAAKAAGLEKIEVLVRDPEAEISRRRKSIISNVQRENVGPIEMAEALQSLLDEDEAIGTQRRLADTIGKSEQWVCDMLKILEMPAPLQEKLRTSVVTLPYDSAAKVARLKDTTLQEELVGELLKGASNRDIRARIDESKGRRATRSLHLKESYTTSQRALVIIESLTDDLSIDRQIAAMEEALVQARQKNGQRLETV
jgi:ParB family chromosome partitioning protein